MSVAVDYASTLDWTDPGPAITGPQEFTADGDMFTLSVLEGSLVYALDRVRFERGDLWGTLTVTTTLAGARTYLGVLSEGTINLSSVDTRQKRARVIAGLAQCPQIDFHRLLESFSVRVHAAVRDGEPGVDLRTVPRPTSVDTLLVDGIALYDRLPMCLFGKGGDGKSLIALYLAGQLVKRGLRVGFLDWELDAGQGRDRLGREHGEEAMPEITYIACTRPLIVEVDRIRRLRVHHALDFLIYDSVAFASHGRPEDAEVALRYAQCVRQIGLGSLHLAHVNKTEEGDKQPFGSSFWHNFFRSTWNLKKSEATGPHELIVACHNRKANLGPLLPSVGFRVAFTPQRTIVETTDLSRVEDLAPDLKLWYRVKMALVSGPPRTIALLAEDLGVKPDSIEKAIKRKMTGADAVFTRIPQLDGVPKIALVERRYAS